MLNNFIYAETKDLFLEQLNAGNILDEAIVFIKDTREIWNHGTYFKCNAEISGGMSDEEIISIVEQETQRAQQVESDIISKLQILIGTDAWDSVRNLIKDELDTQLKSDDISESFDTIKEIAEYLSNNPSVAIEVEKSIKELQENKADKATTLAGYGITDALPKSGGTITNSSTGVLTLRRDSTTNGAYIKYENSVNVLGYLGITAGNKLYLYKGDQTSTASIILDSDNYSEYALPKKGGTISGAGNVPLYIHTSAESQCVVVFQAKGGAKTGVGWSSSHGSYIYNYATGLRIGVKDDGTPYFGSNTLIHAGNYSDYIYSKSDTDNRYLKLEGGGTILTSDYTALALHRRTNSGAPFIKYSNSTGTLGLIGFSINKNPIVFIGDNIETSISLLHAENIGSYNAGSATKLQTARTIWGNSFDGSADVSGDIDLKNNNIKFTNFTITNSTLAFIAATEGWNRGIAIKSTDNTLLGQIGIQGNSNELRYIHLSAGEWSTDVSLRLWQNGNVTIGKTTNASNYKLQVEGSAQFSGDILLDNNRNIYFKNSENASVPLITLNSGNIFALGYGNIAKGYDTRIFGANIHFCYTETATAFYVSRLGNVIVNNDIYMKNTKSIYFKDTSDNYHALLSLTENNILKLGVGSHTTNICGNNIEMFTGTQEPAVALRITDNKDVTVFGILDVNGNIVLHAGNYTDYTGTSSDRSLKSEINTITDSEALSVLTHLNPVTFIWNAVATSLKPSLIGESSGFISDEYESVIPNSGYDMWDKQYRGIDYTRVSSYLVAGWQNHERRISDMEDKTSEIDKLKKIIEDATQKISELESQLNNN